MLYSQCNTYLAPALYNLYLPSMIPNRSRGKLNIDRVSVWYPGDATMLVEKGLPEEFVYHGQYVQIQLCLAFHGSKGTRSGACQSLSATIRSNVTR